MNMQRRTKSLIVSVAALGLMVAGTTLASAAASGPYNSGSTHTISGKAVEADGSPAAGVSISAWTAWGSSGYTYTGQTGADGSYSITVDYATGYFLNLTDWSTQAVSYGFGSTSVTEGSQDPTCSVTLSRVATAQSVIACSERAAFTSPLSDADLTDAVRGGVTMDVSETAVGAGATVTLQLPENWANHDTYLFVYSDPQALSSATVRVDAAAKVSAVLPKDLTVGHHKVAAFDTYGNLIGWAPIEVKATAAASTGTLPVTGNANMWPIGITAGALILAGGGIYLFTKRRQGQAQAK